jgi:hypothetical protein
MSMSRSMTILPCSFWYTDVDEDDGDDDDGDDDDDDDDDDDGSN